MCPQGRLPSREIRRLGLQRARKGRRVAGDVQGPGGWPEGGPEGWPEGRQARPAVARSGAIRGSAEADGTGLGARGTGPKTRCQSSGRRRGDRRARGSDTHASPTSCCRRSCSSLCRRERAGGAWGTPGPALGSSVGLGTQAGRKGEQVAAPLWSPCCCLGAAGAGSECAAPEAPPLGPGICARGWRHLPGTHVPVVGATLDLRSVRPSGKKGTCPSCWGSVTGPGCPEAALGAPHNVRGAPA